MYNVALLLHSWLRWLVLLAAVLVIVRAIAGVTGRKPWTSADTGGLRLFSISFDLQFLLGLVLYIALSPATSAAFDDFGTAMRTSSLRYWAVEHPIGMLAAIALAHIGSVRVRRAADAAQKHSRALVFIGLSLLLIVLSIPWPGMPNGRELFRLGVG